jgi:hypothetical protein
MNSWPQSCYSDLIEHGAAASEGNPQQTFAMRKPLFPQGLYFAAKLTDSVEKPHDGDRPMLELPAFFNNIYPS